MPLSRYFVNSIDLVYVLIDTVVVVVGLGVLGDGGVGGVLGGGGRGCWGVECCVCVCACGGGGGGGGYQYSKVVAWAGCLSNDHISTMSTQICQDRIRMM